MSSASVTNRLRSSQLRRQRELVTPEGLSLPLTIASRGARVGALLLDLIIIALSVVALVLLLLAFGTNMATIGSGEVGGAVEFLVVILIMLTFLARYGYFLFFELGPRGATPGKRIMGIRVAARDGGRLTAEAVIARNLLRDVEVFLPATYLLSGEAEQGVMGVAAFVWLMCFVLFPVFNKDRLRAGDLVAGTWVVEASRVKLAEAMSTAPDRSRDFRFGEEELSVYGEHELQVLEGVLRQDNSEAMHEVMLAICNKIGWEAGAGHEREFLEAFYAALRAHLERNMRFGKRKADKFS
ncbi:RDD family protein [Alteraurantiacibacter aquimixticola]|uniref:RDD family protein n=1 Tax=Alteraurantiacibacter aquimixticola TaxID=2489173 RepID=A0A4T3F626_9SPHN|nr:RDD family protein [Alteraurantiacibacter aquimixticola]TIX51092.1 RDD family protein [Alteraurantiacibacter aquimixticola]